MENYYFSLIILKDCFRPVCKIKAVMPAFFKPEKLLDEILSLCQKNKCTELARIRLSVYRGTGDLRRK